MAIAHGHNCTVTVGGAAQANVIAWEVHAVCAYAESTAMDSLYDMKQYIPGFKSWTATVEIHCDATGPLAGTTAVLTQLGDTTADALVFSDGTITLSGSAWLTGVRIVGSTTDTVTVAFDYKGEDAVE